MGLFSRRNTGGREGETQGVPPNRWRDGGGLGGGPRLCVWTQARPDTEAESGHSQPYPSLCVCEAASARTKGALFWTALGESADTQRRGSKKKRKKKRGQWAHADETVEGRVVQCD